MYSTSNGMNSYLFVFNVIFMVIKYESLQIALFVKYHS